VVPSHGRPDGLTQLLDALAAQTLARERWEVVVVHTYEPALAADLLERHELARAGVLRHIAIDPDSARATRQRNIGWRHARGALIAFTDDDCRPAERWLEGLVACAAEFPGAIVQGTTRPDPLQAAALSTPHVRTIWVEAPGRNTQTCNILYERDLLERIGGFDEAFPAPAAEDVDLALRALAAGAVLVGAPEAVVYHAVDALSLREKLRHDAKWEHLPLLVKRHPAFRWQQCVLGLWWKREHLGALLALAGLAAAPRRPWALAGLWPYYMVERKRHGESLPGRVRALREMPAHWVVEIAEIGRFVRGSVRYRTLVL
jgi:glycosyltransferase involved in cell wall biosynthesis